MSRRVDICDHGERGGECRRCLAPVLDLLESTYRRFVVFDSEHQAVAVTLWTAHTHTIEVVDTTPYIHVSSPEKRSGKTRLLEVAGELVLDPVRGASMSASVLFRLLDAAPRTLLLDEVDAIFSPGSDREELRGMIDAGHSRGTPAWRIEVVGKKMIPTPYDPFAAKMLAGIGNLPDTIEDRSIPIHLKRRRRGDTIERFRRRVVVAQLAEVRERVAEWAANEAACLADAWPELPDALNDRAQDVWEPLLALADLAGGDWPERARAAAVALQADSDGHADSNAVLLLDHVRRIFAESHMDVMTTRTLLAVLFTYEEGPWASWWLDPRDDDHRKAATKLSRILNQYREGPKQNVIKMADGSSQRGYRLEWFEDAFGRYLPPIEEPEGTPLQNGVTRVPLVTPQVGPTSTVTTDTRVTPVSGGYSETTPPEGSHEWYEQMRANPMADDDDMSRLDAGGDPA